MCTKLSRLVTSLKWNDGDFYLARKLFECRSWISCTVPICVFQWWFLIPLASVVLRDDVWILKVLWGWLKCSTGMLYFGVFFGVNLERFLWLLSLINEGEASVIYREGEWSLYVPEWVIIVWIWNWKVTCLLRIMSCHLWTSVLNPPIVSCTAERNLLAMIGGPYSF